MTLLWFAIQKEVNASVTEKLIDVQQQIIKLDQKVIGTREEFSSHGKVKFLSFCNYSVLPFLNKGYYQRHHHHHHHYIYLLAF